MKAYELFEDTRIYWHASQSDLPLGKVIAWKAKQKHHFGDYEKLLEYFRPAGALSRLTSFFLANTRQGAEQFGRGNTYKVQAVGKTSSHYIGWIGLLTGLPMMVGYKSGHGYTVKVSRELSNPDVKYICEQYWSGKKPSTKDFKRFDEEPDGESFIQETLAPKIICLKHFE